MNCIIVDDEYPAIKELAYFIESFSDIRISGEFDDSIKALDYIKECRPDIIFLDINMPKLDGISLGRVIKSCDYKPVIVFITAYREHAVDAFEIEAFDYILKPYAESRIVSTLKKLEKTVNPRLASSKVTLWKGEKMFVVNVKDICFCEAQEREVYVYTEDSKYVINSSITSFYNKLPSDSFFRCHRSYIVNLDRVNEIIPWFNNTFVLKLKGNSTEVPVSRNNIAEFKRIMGI